MIYEVTINNEVCTITFDKKDCVSNASPYLMFMMGRPRTEVDAVLVKRGWTWITSD